MNPASSPPRAGNPFVVLAVIASATLMFVLDASIINIARPRAQASLGPSDTARPWVITAYALSFGGLLLLGARLGDRFGHRRMLLLGLAGFALSSLDWLYRGGPPGPWPADQTISRTLPCLPI